MTCGKGTSTCRALVRSELRALTGSFLDFLKNLFRDAWQKNVLDLFPCALAHALLGIVREHLKKALALFQLDQLLNEPVQPTDGRQRNTQAPQPSRKTHTKSLSQNGYRSHSIFAALQAVFP